MEYTQAMSEIQEREGREADATDRDADTTGEEDYDRVAALLGFHFEDSGVDGYISRERVVVHYPNGYDDTEEEIEDEYEITEIED